MTNKTFLNQLKKAVIDWAKFKPKDEYNFIKKTISDLDGDGWTPTKTCLVYLYNSGKSTTTALWYIRDTTTDAVMCCSKSTSGHADTRFFVALKGHTYTNSYKDANGGDQVLYIYEPTAHGGVCCKTIPTRGCA